MSVKQKFNIFEKKDDILLILIDFYERFRDNGICALSTHKQLH